MVPPNHGSQNLDVHPIAQCGRWAELPIVDCIRCRSSADAVADPYAYANRAITDGTITVRNDARGIT